MPLEYALSGQSSDLFKIDANGIIRLTRPPMDAELNRNYALNVTALAANNISSMATTILNVLLTAPQPPSTTSINTVLTTTVSGADDEQVKCDFKTKIFRAEIFENTNGRHKLTQLKTKGCDSAANVRFTVHQGGNVDDFELNENTGDFFVLHALDRERKSLYIIVVNITYDVTTPTTVDNTATDNENQRKRRQSHAFVPIEGYAKKKLVENQAMIVLRVLDKNDNAPVFTGLNSDGIYVFSVDAHIPLFVSFARISTTDADEKQTNNLTYSLSETDSDYFTINSTTGHLMAERDLVDLNENVVQMEVSANDGQYKSRIPIKIHIIRPGPNAVILTSQYSVDQLNTVRLASNLTRALNIDTRVLASQMYVDEQRHADPERSHVVIYALERGTHTPLAGERLKTIMEERLASHNVSEEMLGLYHISNITLPITSNDAHLSWFEVVLYIFGSIIAVMTCLLVFIMLQWCKKRQVTAKSDMEYMMDSKAAGPRPYNVELITRKMAQNLLAGRKLPEAYEEVTLTPESRATMIASSSIYNASRADNTLSNTNCGQVDSNSLEIADQILHRNSSSSKEQLPSLS